MPAEYRLNFSLKSAYLSYNHRLSNLAPSWADNLPLRLPEDISMKYFYEIEEMKKEEMKKIAARWQKKKSIQATKTSSC